LKTIRKHGIEFREWQVWECKIGAIHHSKIPPGMGADLPMRQAVAAAYMLLFGEEPIFVSSGWNADINKELEKEIPQ
jgi:hypothetical protein